MTTPPTPMTPEQRAAKIAEMRLRAAYVEDIDWLLDQLAVETQRATMWQKTIEGLTPGGSEYFDDPTRCAEFIRSRTAYPRRILELRAERDQLAGEVERFREQLTIAEQIIDNQLAEHTALLGKLAEEAGSILKGFNKPTWHLAATELNALIDSLTPVPCSELAGRTGVTDMRSGIQSDSLGRITPTAHLPIDRVALTAASKPEAVAEPDGIIDIPEATLAEIVAILAHYGQMSKYELGAIYLHHPAAVAAEVEEEDKAAAWLHDVLEDSTFTEGHLLAVGLQPATVEAVKVVTRHKADETYSEFIDRVVSSGNRKAITVKIADIRHNLSPSCPEKLAVRYRAALPRLEEALTRLLQPPQLPESAPEDTGGGSPQIVEIESPSGMSEEQLEQLGFGHASGCRTGGECPACGKENIDE